VQVVSAALLGGAGGGKAGTGSSQGTFIDLQVPRTTARVTPACVACVLAAARR
jgi:hypothetical protein